MEPAQRLYHPTAEMLIQWAREDSARLLSGALDLCQMLQKRSLQLREARERIKELEAQLEAARKVALRQAAPFRRPADKRVGEPKGPGRKPGHPGAFRPLPQHIDQEVAAELEYCPHCGASQWENLQESVQIIEDIPVPRPQVTRLRTYQATCGNCHQESRSHHPLQVSRATGAAGTHLGPRALALAADLNKSKCLTMRKTCRVLHDGFGLKITPGGLSQAMDRLATKAQPLYQEILQGVRHSPVLHIDETSWWLAGKPCWLWVFTHCTGTFYLISRSRSRDLLELVLGDSQPAVLVTDCLSVYDLESGLQQKCYSHHLEAIKKAKALHPEQGKGFLEDVEKLLRRALDLRQTWPLECDQTRHATIASLQAQATDLFTPRRREPLEHAIKTRLKNQQDHLFTFLQHDGVPATNNLAERQLRPAVIARKLSCGNKTDSGAHTFQVLASIAATAAQTQRPFIDIIANTAALNSS